MNNISVLDRKRGKKSEGQRAKSELNRYFLTTAHSPPISDWSLSDWIAQGGISQWLRDVKRDSVGEKEIAYGANHDAGHVGTWDRQAQAFYQNAHQDQIAG